MILFRLLCICFLHVPKAKLILLHYLQVKIIFKTNKRNMPFIIIMRIQCYLQKKTKLEIKEGRRQFKDFSCCSFKWFHCINLVKFDSILKIAKRKCFVQYIKIARIIDLCPAISHQSIFSRTIKLISETLSNLITFQNCIKVLSDVCLIRLLKHHRAMRKQYKN